MPIRQDGVENREKAYLELKPWELLSLRRQETGTEHGTETKNMADVEDEVEVLFVFLIIIVGGFSRYILGC